MNRFLSLLGTHHRLPAAGASLLSALGVAVELGGREIVHGVDLSVSPGEVVALVGPNGAGKSTLLGALAGDLPLARGEVRVDGEPLTHWTPVELSMRRAVMLQQARVSFPFSVREVVAMGRAPWAATDREEQDAEMVDRALRETAIEHLGDRSFATLSGGEQARASLARCLAQDTATLLLDEPTAALDLHHQEVILDLARARAEQGVGVVIVMHDLTQAGAHADRIVVMSEGCVVGDGAPKDVLTQPLLSDVYGHDVEVIRHPRSKRPIVLPRR